MKNNGTDGEISKQSPGRTEGGSINFLGAVALFAVAAGGIGSAALTIREGSSAPRLLLVVFVIWVLLPFAAQAWANLVSKRWAMPTRVSLYCASMLISLGSLAIYGGMIARPTRTANSFMFVVTPALSLLILGIVVGAAALIGRRRSR